MHVPHLGKKLKILSVIILVILFGGIATGLLARSSGEPRIDFFDVEKKNFLAESHDLKRMEVWVVPAHAKSEAQWKALGLMERTSHWFSWSSWSLPIPKDPLPVLQIMVRGYDKQGTEIDRVSLPWIGPETLKREVWKIEN
jgi:hypothetical protein